MNNDDDRMTVDRAPVFCRGWCLGQGVPLHRKKKLCETYGDVTNSMPASRPTKKSAKHHWAGLRCREERNFILPPWREQSEQTKTWGRVARSLLLLLLLVLDAWVRTTQARHRHLHLCATTPESS